MGIESGAQKDHFGFDFLGKLLGFVGQLIQKVFWSGVCRNGDVDLGSLRGSYADLLFTPGAREN